MPEGVPERANLIASVVHTLVHLFSEKEKENSSRPTKMEEGDKEKETEKEKEEENEKEKEKEEEKEKEKERDLQQEIEELLLHTVSERGTPMDMVSTGWLFEMGAIFPQNYERAFEWYEKAANGGLITAQTHLGALYVTGKGVTKNVKKAIEWYEKAVAQDSVEAMHDLGWVYAEISEVKERDEVKAVEMFLKAAKKGFAPAQNKLALMYLTGRGVAKDARKAVEWYRKAAEQGYAPAQYNMGLQYASGEGVEAINAKEALSWFLKAAKQGHLNAQFNAACTYYEEKQNRLAAEWWQRAAEKGDAPSICNIGDMYAQGEGVAKDIAKAVMLYTMAAKAGSTVAASNLERWQFAIIH